MARWIVFIALLLVCLPKTIHHLKTFVEEAAGDSRYATYSGGDEVFVVNAAESVLRGGYFGLRCREGHTGSCYGGTQILLDGFLLKTLPASWLEKDQLISATAVNWPYLRAQPNILKALRWTRVAYALGVLLVLGVCVFLLSRDGLLAFALPLALGSSPIFAHAWQGAKNDFPSALGEIVFLFFALRLLQRPGLRRLLATTALGVIVTFIRPVLLPLLPLMGACYLYAGFQKMPWRHLLRDAVSAAMLVGIVFALLHPNMFVSSLEANWILALLHMGIRTTFQPREILQALQAAWPLAVAALAWRKKKDVGGLFLFGAAFFFFYVNLKTSYLRLYYYLPALSLGLIALGYSWPENTRFRERTLALVALFAAGFSFLSPPIQIHTPPPSISAAETPGRAVDLALHPPIRKGARPDEILFFDSLVDSPAALAGRLKSTDSVMVACWRKDSDLGAYDAPAARLWAELTEKFCPEKESVTEAALHPYVSGVPATKFAILPASAIFSAAKIPEFRGTRISPRILSGFWQGMDNYGSDLLLRQPARLEGKFLFPLGLRQISVPVASDCKDNSTVELKVSFGKTIRSSGPIGLDAREKLCGDYPRLCRWPWFQTWSQRRFAPRTPLALTADLPPGTVATIAIESTAKDCTVEVQSLEL